MSEFIYRPLVRVIGRVRYDTEKSTILASDAYWDGHNMNRRGRNTFLFRSPKGKYFVAHYTSWQGECDSIEVLDEDSAADLYETLDTHSLSFEEAFPKLTITEA